jgi:hypothetical protein
MARGGGEAALALDVEQLVPAAGRVSPPSRCYVVTSTPAVSEFPRFSDIRREGIELAAHGMVRTPPSSRAVAA